MTRTHANSPRDDGLTMIELLVAILILGVVSAATLTLIITTIRSHERNTERVTITSHTDDANMQLGREVMEANQLLVADTGEMILTHTVDGLCRQETWAVINGNLQNSTRSYETESCSGAYTDHTRVVLERVVNARPFTYWGQSQTVPLPTPVDDTRYVRRIQWDLEARLLSDKWDDPATNKLGSSAVYTGRGDSTGTGVQVLQGQRPLLTVITDATGVEGADAPVLQWIDPTASITKSYTILRRNGPEGAPLTNFLSVATVGAGTTTWTDPSLPAGYRGVYLVIATLTDGTAGPGSNTVDTGMRPDVVQGVTATGQTTSIKVDWTARTGATGYDVYRDGALVANFGNVTTWTDRAGSSTATESLWPTGTNAGYGHTHTYRVVAVNRWESLAATGDENARVPLGHTYNTPLNGVARKYSSSVGAFTAPAAPSITATPTASGSTYSTTIAWTPAGWTGSGPTSGRDATWDTQWKNDYGQGSFATLWSGTAASTTSKTHTGRTPAGTETYQARTCNSSGCSPWSSADAALQRPAAPTSCGFSGVSTHGMNVTINASSTPSAPSSFTLTHLSGGGNATGTGTRGTGVFTIDRLYDGEVHGYSASVSNASGASPAISCSQATPALVASTPACSRTINDSTAPGGFTVSGGTHVKLGSSGATYGSPQYFGSLSSGTYYGYAANYVSDGYNDDWSPWDACPAATINPGPPPAPACYTGMTGFWNTASDMTNMIVFPCETTGSTNYQAEVQYKSSVDGIVYTTSASYSTAMARFSTAWGGHSDWVKVRMQAVNSSGLWSSYGPWLSLPDRTG